MRKTLCKGSYPEGKYNQWTQQIIADPKNLWIGRRDWCRKWIIESKWHNPYRLKDYGNNNVLVIQKYYEHIIKTGLIFDIHELIGLDLYCKCSFDVECHGDLLTDLLKQF